MADEFVTFESLHWRKIHVLPGAVMRDEIGRQVEPGIYLRGDDCTRHLVLLIHIPEDLELPPEQEAERTLRWLRTGEVDGTVDDAGAA